jgi:hypothetical protein
VILSGIMLKKTKSFSGEAAPFVMELPAIIFLMDVINADCLCRALSL